MRDSFRHHLPSDFKTTMFVLAVLDVRGGTVVHAVAGERHRYLPLVSRLVRDTRPVEVAQALRERLGLSRIYLADLDALTGDAPQTNVVETLLLAGFEVWLDAGIRTVADAQKWAALARKYPRLTGVVIAAESLTDPSLLPAMVAALGPERAIFSLDLRHGTLLTQAPQWAQAAPEEVANQVLAAGVGQILVLDLAVVGTSSGVAHLPLLQHLLNDPRQPRVSTGGGIRHVADLQELQRLGCHASLLATALHSSRLGQIDLAPFA